MIRALSCATASPRTEPNEYSGTRTVLLLTCTGIVWPVPAIGPDPSWDPCLWQDGPQAAATVRYPASPTGFADNIMAFPPARLGGGPRELPARRAAVRPVPGRLWVRRAWL